MIVGEIKDFETSSGSIIKGIEISQEGFPYKFYLNEYRTDCWVLWIELTGSQLWSFKNISKDSVILKIKSYFEDKYTLSDVNDVITKSINNGSILNKFGESYNKKIFIQYKDRYDINKIFYSMNLGRFFKNIFVNKSSGTIQKDSMYILPSNLIVPLPENIERIPIKGLKHKTNNKYNLIEIGTIGKRVDVFSDIIPVPIIHYYTDFNTLLIHDVFQPENIKWILVAIKELGIKEQFTPKPFEITIGCDPEFECIKNGKVILPPYELNGIDRLRCSIGTDGHGSQIELRTNACENEDELVNELTKGFYKLSNLNLSSESKKEPCGGHIHIGIKKYNIISCADLTNEVRILFNSFLGQKFDKICLGRKENGFGNMNDFRNQPWGFEYRTLPSACFHNPEIVKIIMKISKNLCYLYYNSDPMEFNLFPTKEDYIKLCNLTESEYDYFLNFGNLFESTRKENVIKFWCNDKNNHKTNVEFFDKWEEKNKELFIEQLSDMIVPYNVNIILYGLKNNNNISGISVHNMPYTLVNHPNVVHTKNGICFGLPIDYRINTGNKQNIILLCNMIKLKMNRMFIDYINEKDFTTEKIFSEEIDGIKYNDDCALPRLLGLNMPITFVNKYRISSGSIPSDPRDF